MGVHVLCVLQAEPVAVQAAVVAQGGAGQLCALLPAIHLHHPLCHHEPAG